MTNEQIKEALSAKFPTLSEWETPHDLLTFRADAQGGLKVLQYLYDDDHLAFRFLTDITAVHFPGRTGEELCVVYHLHSLETNARLRMKLYVPEGRPDVYSATSLFSGANWMERETYDFFGINFIGHPNLTRILNVDEMDYFPMRKQYPMEDPTRTDKDDDMFGRGGSY
ncbi:MAG TPA: NADH-quinone oxidoreductase subunit C [Edaphocola sp.]|nr:NADH-quinone oxidoreductase subunit C [Edaphocola sp.]